MFKHKLHRMIVWTTLPAWNQNAHFSVHCSGIRVCLACHSNRGSHQTCTCGLLCVLCCHWFGKVHWLTSFRIRNLFPLDEDLPILPMRNDSNVFQWGKYELSDQMRAKLVRMSRLHVYSKFAANIRKNQSEKIHWESLFPFTKHKLKHSFGLLFSKRGW